MIYYLQHCEKKILLLIFHAAGHSSDRMYYSISASERCFFGLFSYRSKPRRENLILENEQHYKELIDSVKLKHWLWKSGEGLVNSARTSFCPRISGSASAIPVYG